MRYLVEIRWCIEGDLGAWAGRLSLARYHQALLGEEWRRSRLTGGCAKRYTQEQNKTVTVHRDPPCLRGIRSNWA